MSFAEEAKKRADLVRKAIVEGRMISFRWNNDGSGCDFNYRGIDHHGLDCEFKSSLNRENSIYALQGLKMTFEQGEEKKQVLTKLEKTTSLCELVAELKATEEQIQAIRAHAEQMIQDEQDVD